MNFIFSVFFVLFMIAFFVILGKNIAQWFKNNNSPRLSVNAKIVARRESVEHHHHHNGHHDMGTTYSTTYYVTFQVESGDRMEFYVPSNEYGYLAEGDEGILRFQGTRYLGFDRR